MIKIRIDKNRYKLPAKVEELTIAKGCELNQLYEDYPVHNLDYKKTVLSILMDCPTEELGKVADSHIELLHDNHQYFDVDLKVFVPDAFYLNGTLYSLMDLDQHTVKEYIEIEELMDQGVTLNLHKVAAVLFRPSKNQPVNTYSFRSRFKRGMHKSKIRGKAEELDLDYKDRSNLFYNNIPFYVAKSMLLRYLDFKKSLLDEYQMLAEELPEDQQDEYDEEDKEKAKSFEEQWGMYHALQVAANEDLIQIDHWLNKNIRQLFVYLYYQKQKQLIINK